MVVAGSRLEGGKRAEDVERFEGAVEEDAVAGRSVCCWRVGQCCVVSVCEAFFVQKE